MRMNKLAIFLCSLTLVGCAAAPVAAPPDMSRPSVAATQTVEFIGKQFQLKFKDTDKPVRIYEYYPAQDSPSDWMELTEFQVYPVRSDGNEPMDFAKRLAVAFKQKYPYMQFALYSDNNTGAAMLDFFYPTSTRKDKDKDFLEFNAFKFFRDAGSAQTMSFHYARNIESTSASRPMASVSAEVKETRRQVVPAMAKFPLYRQ